MRKAQNTSFFNKYDISSIFFRLCLFLGTSVLLSVISLLLSLKLGGNIAVPILIAAGALFTGIGIWVVYSRIYLPVLSLEQALEAFENADENFAAPLGKYAGLYPAAGSLKVIQTRFKESIDREYTAKMKQHESEVRALQNQINPHFLYNTLDGIRSLAIINSDREVADMTKALSDFFRYNISQKGHIVTVRNEIDNARNYIFIQNMRFNNKFDFSVRTTYDSENALDMLIPKLTLQPIIENSIFHGLEPKIGKGHITIRIFSADDTLNIIIHDDGVGMSEEKLRELRDRLSRKEIVPETFGSSGIALVNIHQRIRLNYGPKYGLNVASTEGVGSEVDLKLPIAFERNDRQEDEIRHS